MDIDELVRAARPRTAPGWARSEAGQRVLDGVVAAPPAAAGRSARRPPVRPGACCWPGRCPRSRWPRRERSS